MIIGEILVIVLGAAVLGGVLWTFLGPTPASSLASGSRAQEFRVVIRGGFQPDTILVETGHPVRLHIYRDESAPRSDRVVFDQLDIDQPLTPFETTTVEFTPRESGDYSFHCGRTLRGVVAAQVGGEGARANLGRGHHKHG